MTVRIAIVSDLHAGPQEEDSPRRGDLAELLLERAVRRLARWIKPDVVILAGDLVEPAETDAQQRLERIGVLLAKLSCPVLALRGNHECEPDVFYRVLPRPPKWLDVKGTRFVCFDDPEEPGFNARRTQADLERMASVAEGFSGPLVSVQHVPVVPPDAPEAGHVLYRVLNSTDVIRVMRRCGYTLSVAGHFHEGFGPVRREGQTFLGTPALCKPPFPYVLVEMHRDRVRVKSESLAMPAEEHLVDCHVHTEFAYCSDNMETTRSLELADVFGLQGLTLTEHASHLYFTRPEYKSHLPLREGLPVARPEELRFDQWRNAMRAAGAADESVALEVDCDFAGRPVIRPGDERQVQFLMGSVHQVPESLKDEPNVDRMIDEFMANTEAIVRSGIRVLAHPFRVFRRKGMEAPTWLYEPVVRLLREHSVAAEINFHKAVQDPAFYALCLQAGVRLTLGSDSHQLSQVGELWPHLRLLNELGITSNCNDVLLDPRR